MGSKKRFIPRGRLSMGQQHAQMLAVWPTLDTRVESGVLVVRGLVQPSPLTQSYRVRVTYRQGEYPKAYVIEPRLTRRAAQPDVPIPHTYDAQEPGKERPCLFFWKEHEWTPEMPIATSVMPWLLTWLVDYELWLALGEWLGGGVNHAEQNSGAKVSPGGVAA